MLHCYGSGDIFPVGGPTARACCIWLQLYLVRHIMDVVAYSCVSREGGFNDQPSSCWVLSPGMQSLESVLTPLSVSASQAVVTLSSRWFNSLRCALDSTLRQVPCLTRHTSTLDRVALARTGGLGLRHVGVASSSAAEATL